VEEQIGEAVTAEIARDDLRPAGAPVRMRSDRVGVPVLIRKIEDACSGGWLVDQQIRGAAASEVSRDDLGASARAHPVYHAPRDGSPSERRLALVDASLRARHVRAHPHDCDRDQRPPELDASHGYLLITE